MSRQEPVADPASPPDGDGVFHAGEAAVQARAGVREQAAGLGPQMIRSRLDADFAAFLGAQPFVIVAGVQPSGRVSASILAGNPGFARAASPTQVVVQATIPAADPLAAALADGSAPVGMLVIDPMTRGRIRLNGIGAAVASGLELELREVFGNCPKYIQRRRPQALSDGWGAEDARECAGLDQEQARLVQAADTFFIASRHPQRGADASHRGGRPGFARVTGDGRRLTFPDYRGNNMFQTLGNITVEPAVGLLFVDWDTGRTLQLSGRAEIVWDGPRLAAWPGAQRLVDVELDAVLDRRGGSPFVWEFVEASRVSPLAPAHGS